MHKLDKYLKKICPEHVVSPRSRYYRFNNYILRVSDHIGQNASGSYSIIISNDNYLLHSHGNGSIVVLTYKQILMFVKSIKICSSLATIAPAISEFEIDRNDTKGVVGTPFQERILKAYRKLTKSSCKTFRTTFGLQGVHMEDFASWSTKKLKSECIEGFFKNRGIKF